MATLTYLVFAALIKMTLVLINEQWVFQSRVAKVMGQHLNKLGINIANVANYFSMVTANVCCDPPDHSYIDWRLRCDL